MRPWDFAAGVTLAKSLGLRVGTIDEQPMNMLVSGSVLVATDKAYADIMALLQKKS
jgi:myo-inositol-1(or 4)-monophosphatase